MVWGARYLIAILPPLLLYGAWKVSAWAVVALDCGGHPKALGPCLLGGLDVTLLLGIGLYWCALLWLPAIPLSGWLILRTYRLQRRGG